MSALPIASMAKGATQEFNQLATQRVIGISKSISYIKGGKKHPKVISENHNIAIQAWEIGAIIGGAGLGIASIAAYEYLTGNPIKQLKDDITGASNIDKESMTGQGLPAATAKPTWYSGIENFFKVLYP